jgi:hypothetical protein
VHTLILAAVNPDNTPHGYNWTFAFPMLLFIIIGTVLYLLFSRPHRRIPARSLTLPARTPAAPSAAGAEAAAVAGGLTVAPGGGTAESHLEPHGAHLAASLDTGPADTGPADTGPADTGPAGDAGEAADSGPESQKDAE